MLLIATILSNINKMTEILKVPKSWKIKKKEWIKQESSCLKQSRRHIILLGIRKDKKENLLKLKIKIKFQNLNLNFQALFRIFKSYLKSSFCP